MCFLLSPFYKRRKQGLEAPLPIGETIMQSWVKRVQVHVKCVLVRVNVSVGVNRAVQANPCEKVLSITVCVYQLMCL